MQRLQRTTALLLLIGAGWAYAQADEKPSFAAQMQIADDDQQAPRYIIKYKELTPSPMGQTNQPQPLSAGQFERRAAQRLLSQAQVQPLMHLDSQAASVPGTRARVRIQAKSDEQPRMKKMTAVS